MAETFLREKALKESRKAFAFDNAEALAGKRARGGAAGGAGGAGVADLVGLAGEGEGEDAGVKKRRKTKAKEES